MRKGYNTSPGWTHFRFLKDKYETFNSGERVMICSRFCSFSSGATEWPGAKVIMSKEEYDDCWRIEQIRREISDYKAKTLHSKQVLLSLNKRLESIIVWFDEKYKD